MSLFDGKVAIVTGAASGIGKEIALRFAARGGTPVIADVNLEAADATAREIKAKGSDAFVVGMNVADEAQVEKGVADTIAKYGRIDVLVSNAGIQKAQPITEMTADDWDRMMAVHLRGAFLCCREVAPVMMAQKSGRIIILTSQLAYIGRPRYTAYSAAKGGLLTFTRALAQELAPYGVLVNSIAPGLIDTGFDPLPEDVKRAHAASLPLKRLGMPEDLVGAFVFLASDESRYFCGQTLHPNGGEIMP